MQKFLIFMFPAFIAFISTFPFLALEFNNQQYPDRDFPVALFGVLFVTSAAIALRWRCGRQNMQIAGNKLAILVRFTLLISLVLPWWGIVKDQLRLEKSHKELCYKKRHEKTISYWMSHPHRGLRASSHSDTPRTSLPHRDAASDASPCYLYSCTHFHA
jgi:hypothetical protein